MILANGGSPFDPIYNFFGAILAFFYGLIPNLGVSIILLTVVVMLALFPLTAKQAKAMLAMQRAQPEIKKLQAKYKGDRQKLNEEMMKYYQENKINPLAGCLPLLVQLPIFFALFRVMRTPYQHVPRTSDLYAAFCTNPAGKVVGQAACGKPPLPNPLSFLGMDLSQSATGVSGGFIDALPYFILVGLVILTGFLQARQSRRNSPNMPSQMAMITNILPIAFGVFSLQFPAGLVLYFLVSNTWRLGQQELIMRKITRPGMAANQAAAGGAIDAKSSAAPGGRAPGGLRKLFQLPPAANGDVTSGDTTGNGAGGSKSSPAKTPGPSGGTKRNPSTGGSANPAGSGSPQRSSRPSGRRSNKKRKRR
jgi:YidC/Oxa1 family membrane protein insertase